MILKCLFEQVISKGNYRQVLSFAGLWSPAALSIIVGSSLAIITLLKSIRTLLRASSNYYNTSIVIVLYYRSNKTKQEENYFSSLVLAAVAATIIMMMVADICILYNILFLDAWLCLVDLFFICYHHE